MKEIVLVLIHAYTAIMEVQVLKKIALTMTQICIQ